jgi:hypothetical protein
LSLPSRRIEPFGHVESRTPNDATFSHDGHWVAYDVDDGTGSRVYVEPFPRTGDRYPVTNEQGWNPMWSSDKELMFASGPDHFRVVRFSSKPTISFGSAVLVPKGRIFEGGGPDIRRRNYDLSRDGNRILGQIMGATREQALAPTIEVVLNWDQELKRLVPTR